MNELMRLATAEIAKFLEAQLPEISPNWWNKNVIDRLSFQQQRTAQERNFRTLQELDFAGLLRVLDQNWYELSNATKLPREGRNWLKELQTVRNKWAHLSAQTIPASELYRDADTLGRLLEVLAPEAVVMQAVDALKNKALTEISSAKNLAHLQNNTASNANNAHANATSTIEHIAPSLFLKGDLVALRSSPTELMPILDVLVGSTENRYQVFHNNTKNIYYESQLQAPPNATLECTPLTTAQLQAHLTSVQLLSPSTAHLFSMHSGRVQFVPYQYRPVLKLIRADRPRLLIADEVGVGKTIEAGLIIKELSARMNLNSILVICPKALVAERKWFTEMKRFDEHFTALDGASLRHCLHETHLDGEWPAQYNKALLPFSLFDSDLLLGNSSRAAHKKTGLLDLDPPPKFDLVIVDEAHHIRNPSTFLHQGVRYFCDNAQAVVLLTATPVQLGSNDLFTLLNVIRPDLVIDKASFEQMTEPNPHINAAIGYCRAAELDWQIQAKHCLDAVAQTEWGRLFLREGADFQRIYDQLGQSSIADAERIALIYALEELYTFSKLINRTRRRDIGAFTTRNPRTVRTNFTPPQQQLHDSLLTVVAKILEYCHGHQNVKFMMTTLRRQAASCLYGLAPTLSDMLTGKLDRLEIMELSDTDTDIEPGLGADFTGQIRTDVEQLLIQAQNLDPQDPKIAAFVKVLQDKNKLSNNKALVFSTFRHTLSYLAQHAQQAGLRVALIHGGVPDEERASLRQRFALNKENREAIDVLISSEVGCEGLDFQFCDLLINYDLPWNPMRVEQRIGRIDRYGQTSETIAIVNFVTPNTVDADIYDRCLWRIGIFQQTIGGNEEILGQLTQELHDIAESFELSEAQRTERLAQLADNGIRQIQEEQTLDAQQANLFGLNIPNQSWRNEVAAAETFWLSEPAIAHTVATYIAQRTGQDTLPLLGDKPLKSLRLTPEARSALLADYQQLPRTSEMLARDWEKWLRSTQPTLQVTFEQKMAAENPKAIHLSVLHPLVRQAARFLDIEETQYYRFTQKSNVIAAGVHYFALYRWVKKGFKPDELLVAVAQDAQVESALLDWLQTATDPCDKALPQQADCDVLDARHYNLWSAERANHIASHQQLVAYRIQSLTASHQGRCMALEAQIKNMPDPKIRLMRGSELKRANKDFDQKLAELQQLEEAGDICANPVVWGTVLIIKGE